MAVDEVPTRRSCGTMEVHERLLRTDPSYLTARVRSESNAWEVEASGGVAARAGITVLQTVVHVIFRTGAQNISDAQVQSQIDVLNRDFRMTNADVRSLPPVFAPLAADARIEFELASTDPRGRATNGITRTRTTAASFTDDDRVKSSRTGGADAWPTDRYLNIWVCQLGGGLLGYAQFPGGLAATDGVVILQSAFGTNGTASAPFNLGRTATHEIGHWLNLRHIWGDDGNGCSGDDFVADTPNCAGPNTGTPAFPVVTCRNGPNGDLFMNYMDYTDDLGMFMFTQGQVARMQACLDADRPSIGTVKPGPKLKISDDPVTFKFSDDGGSLKFIDDPQTLKFRDDPVTLKFSDDGGSLKFADDPQTLKFRDDPKLKFADDPQTLKFRDDPKLKFADDPIEKVPGTEGIPIGPIRPIDPIGPVAQPIGPIGREPVPFVLSTPHHSQAWSRSFPGAFQQELARLAQQIGEYEQLLQQYQEAQASGQLTPEDEQALAQLAGEHARLLGEYQRLTAGG